MKRSYLFLLILILSSGNLLLAQKSEIKRGNSLFKQGEYFRALESYNAAKENGAELSVDVQKRIAYCYYYLNDIDKAFEAFSALESKLKPEDYFIYASTIHKFGFYQGAIEWYEKAKKEGGANPIQVNELIKSCKWAEANSQLRNDIRVTPSTLLTFGQSFGIQYYKNGVVYSSASEVNTKKLDKTGKEFLNLYFSELKDGKIVEGTARPFSKNLMFDYHVGAISFTSDYKTMYYTKSVRVKGGRSIIKIFSVNYDGKDWVNETELPICSNDYDVAYPAVSPDDKYLYFVSNMRGSMGGTDIYVVERLSNGRFGTPVNLGRNINTYGDERFPFVSKDNKLYFASDGHLGFGGLDIFVATQDENGKWGNVKNLMKPMNSNYDDFGYVIDPNDSTRGFLSSNNFGDHTKDVIFIVEPKIQEKSDEENQAPIAGLENIISDNDNSDVEEQEPVVKPEESVEKPAVSEDLSKFPSEFSTKLTSTFNGTPINGVKVTIKDANTGEIVGEAVTDAAGNVTITIPDKYKNDQQEFEIVMTKDGEYNTKRMIVHIMELQDINNNGLQMTPVFNDLVLDEISGMTIPYRGNKITPEGYKILDKLAAFLISNPNIVVKLNGHTDARGNMYNNLNLSQLMADKAEEYLVSKGVNEENVIPRGYGERYLVNKCGRGKYCTEAEHLKNRRIEVVVWRIKK
ncbi:MAG: OmpA family protein [Chlorobi bacterium]|nr:OmpA family protein [Chlorobiota bacterium]